MRRVAQAPSHYEVELRQPDPGENRTGTTWRPVRSVQPDGTMPPLKFGSLAAAQAYARRMSRQESRIVRVASNGWRRVVNAAET